MSKSKMSWIRRLFARTAATSRRRLDARLRLETLEDRTVPAILMVTAKTDTNAPGELRTQIAAANANDTINFANNLLVLLYRTQPLWW